MSYKFHDFASAAQTAQTLACDVATCLTVATTLHGRASLVVSGGSTPIAFFEALKPLLPSIASLLTVTLADERCVSSTHPDSNERLVREHLLLPSMLFVPLNHRWHMEGAFTVVVLGMGEDGHTASLFPHHPQLAEAMTDDAPDVMAIHGAPKPPPERITLSARRLLDTQHLFIHITGEAKHATLERAKAASLPITRFLHHPHCSVYWSK